MQLYKRDYSTLTPEEVLQLNEHESAGSIPIGERFVISRSTRDLPKAVRHHLQLFPNNYLEVERLVDGEQLRRKLEQFTLVLCAAPERASEREILSFIRENEFYLVFHELLQSNFHSGHHGAFLFPEFRLGTSFQVDYLVVGKGSGGWTFVFVELESPTPNSVLKDGNLGSPFRKGLSQIQDWKEWLESNYLNLREFFEKAKSSRVPLPEEFVNYDSSRHRFVVVAGRRSDFRERTYRLRREQAERVLLLHYDNLIDYASERIRLLPS
jgi:hypothetical protein